jgi:hypothetical protein
MTVYLAMTLYDPDSDLQRSDQITVPAEVWEQFDREHEGSGPIFVELGGSGLIGRLRPAIPADALTHDACRIPEWMRVRLGLPEFGEEWIALDACQLPAAGTIVLRARKEGTLTGSADPVAMLTAALSGSGGPSWACLCAGSELPLACGVFDVMEVRSVEDFPVPSACILDTDVNLELVPALDHVPPPPPVAPAPVPAPVPAAPVPAPVAAPVAAPAPVQRRIPGMPRGFVPFSGQGRRLGGP